MKSTVLIVDDEPQIRRAVRHALEHDSWRVAEAATGREAIDAVTAARPDVIVLDLGLPDLDGIDACRVMEGADVSVVLPDLAHA